MTTPKSPAQIIQEAAAAIQEAAAAITDPLQRARLLEDAQHLALPALQRVIRLERALAAREAMKTRTSAQVAAELGLDGRGITRSRLYKLLEELDPDVTD